METKTLETIMRTFWKKQRPPNLWEMQIRLVGELQSRFSQPLIDIHLGQGVCLPRCRYELCQSSRWHLTQQCVQGLSQQCFLGTFFGNCLWPDLSKNWNRDSFENWMLFGCIFSASRAQHVSLWGRWLLCLKKTGWIIMMSILFSENFPQNVFLFREHLQGEMEREFSLGIISVTSLSCHVFIEATGTGPLILGPIRV